MSDNRRLDLDAIEARAKAATQGPWWRDQAQDGEMLPDGTGHAGEYYETNDVIGPPIGEERYTNDVATCFNGPTAEFIAHSWEDVLGLVAEVRAQRQRTKLAEEQLKAIDSINEDDWESGEAAAWVCKIRSGLPIDGMVTQEDWEQARNQ